VVIPLAVILLLVAAFVTYGAITRIGPTRFSRGGERFAAPPTPAAVGSDESEGETPEDRRPDGRPDGDKGGRREPARDPSNRTGAGSAGTATEGGGIVVSLPLVGRYEVRIDGHESVSFGPFSACSRDLPESTTLVVNRASGESSTSFVFDHTFSGEHKERHIYRYTDQGVFLDFEGAEVTCRGVRQTAETEFSPPQRRVALPLRVGASWSGSGGDSGRTEDYRAEVVGKDRVEVEGRGFIAFVIETSITLTGDESGRRFQRWWFAPDAGMALRWYEEIEATRFGATYSMQATFTVASLP
jgi:hypothetical protein